MAGRGPPSIVYLLTETSPTPKPFQLIS
uniref:Uncharacterized protein n=1 Tax=Rhizophora mucronata TaxID=61149 RepID=A0A2P2R340_RHIMU